MHPIVKEVKTGGKVVENLTVECFDNFDELVAAIPADKIVQYYNTQKIENERNIARAKHQPSKASDGKRRMAAFLIAVQQFNGELTTAVENGTDAVEALLKRADIQKLVDEKLGAPTV